MTALDLALGKSNEAFMRKLVRAGADAGAALLNAVEKCDWTIVSHLLNAGANVNNPNRFGTTPIIEVVRKGSYSFTNQSDKGRSQRKCEGQDGTYCLDGSSTARLQ